MASAAAKSEVRESLQGWGCTTDEMSGAAWILPELRLAAQSGSAFQAVILDMEVPDVDASVGIEIAADPLVFNTALIALTSNPRPADDARLREKGFRACLAKPLVAAELHRALVSVLQPDEEIEIAPAVAVAAPRPVRTPAPVAAALPAPPLPAPQPRVEPVRAKPALTTGRPPRVLVAEDNLVNQKLVLRLLEKVGLSADVVAAAANGSQAVAAIRQDGVRSDPHGLPDAGDGWIRGDGGDPAARRRYAAHDDLRADGARDGRRPRTMSRRRHGRLH